MKNMSVNMRAAALVLFSFAAYNIGDAFLRHTTQFYSFAEAALYPVLFYGLYTIVFSKPLGGLRPLLHTKKIKIHLIRCTFGTSCFLCMVYAFTQITFGEAYTLLLTAPFWVAILSIIFFKEHIGRHRWTAIGVGFIGVLIVLRPGIIAMEPASLGALMASFFFTVFVIFTKKLGPDEPLINMVVYPIVCDILFLIPIILYMGDFHPPEPVHFIYFALSGLFYLIGTYCASIGFSTGDSSLLAPIQYSQILWGLILGLLFFNEMPEIWTLLGSAVIIASGMYLVYRENKRAHLNNI